MTTYWAVLGGFKFQIEGFDFAKYGACEALWQEVDGERTTTYHNNAGSFELV